ncbi:hypothetical protein [Microbacterium sp. NPDC056736]|uniref:hypothetical protein n=1 Tax=Microbacterium sp. NPDC056736 TaxID=3345932 RepID=UPI0036733E33
MRNRALAVIGTAVLLALSGCTTPEPATPTPTAAFSSEEEAFAAAEETYRAYVDALNQVDLSDPETFEQLYSLTVADLNASDRKQFSEWHADGLTKTGDAVVSRVEGKSYEEESGRVEIDACYDVGAVDIKNAQGESLVSAERPDIQPLTVVLVSETGQPTGLSIAAISASERLQC